MLSINCRIRETCFECVAKPFKWVAAFLKKLIQKVSSIACFIFAKLSSEKNVSGSFSKREVTLIREMHPPGLKRSSKRLETGRLETGSGPRPGLGDKDIKLKSEIFAEVDQFKQQKIPPYIHFDESLEEFRQFLRDYCSLCIDILHASKVAKKLDSGESLSPAVSSIFKALANLFMESRDRTEKSILRKLSQQKTETIDPSLQKVFKMLVKPALLRKDLSDFLCSKFKEHSLANQIARDEYMRPILQYVASPSPKKPVSEYCLSEEKCDPEFLQMLAHEATRFWDELVNVESSELYRELEQKIRDEFADSEHRQEIKDAYIAPVLSWLILSDFSTPLANLTGPLDSQKEAIVDKIFERCLELLVERKINQYSSLFETALQKNLNSIIYKTMQVNSERIVDFLSERIAHLIGAAPFKEIFDSLIQHVVLPHIKGMNEAMSLVHEHRALVKKAEQAALMTPKNALDEEMQQRAKNYLKQIDELGGEDLFLKNVLIDEYSDLPICSTNIQEAIEEEIKLSTQKLDSKFTILAKEKALFSSISNDLFDLILPSNISVPSNETAKTTDPFVELWERLYFPEEFYEIFNHFFKTTEEFVNPEMLLLLETIKTPALDIFKSIFLSCSKEILKRSLTLLVEMGFRELTDSLRLIELVSTQWLPTLNKNLLQLLIGQCFEKNLPKFIPLMHALVTDDPENRERHLNELQALLIKEFKLSYKDLSSNTFHISEVSKDDEQTLKTLPLSEDDWQLITRPLIKEYEKAVSQVQSKNCTPLEIKNILQKHFQIAAKENDPVFGEIFTELAFKAGNLPNEGLVSYFVKDAVSTELTTSVAPLRAGHQFLIDSITSSLKSTLLNRDYCESLLFGPPAPKPKYVEEKLSHQIHVTASLAHELILCTAGKKGAIASLAAKKYITDKPDMLDQLIRRVFNQLFRNSLLNTNLVQMSCLEIFRSLKH